MGTLTAKERRELLRAVDLLERFASTPRPTLRALGVEGELEDRRYHALAQELLEAIRGAPNAGRRANQRRAGAV